MMRSFVVLCLLAIASADKLGYNYQPVAHSDEGLSFQPGASSGAAVLSQPIEQAPVQVAAAPAPAVEEYHKDFYSFSAPNHEFEDPGSDNIVQTVKKNVQVVFIRGPENQGLERAALQLARQSDEHKTAIYVLQKQADVSGFAQQLQSQGAVQSPPEVHFVKYRTQQDAQNAQQTIQSQYDQLPGSSRSSNGGVAPVLNYASQAPVAHAAAAAAAPAAPAAQYLPSNPVPQQNYLPPSFRFLRRF